MNTFKKALAEIKALTEINDHTSAYIEVCNLLGSSAVELKGKLEQIRDRQEREGSLSMDLYYERHGLYMQLMTLAESELGDRSKAIRSAL